MLGAYLRIEPYPATAVVPMPEQSAVTLGYADAADAADAATKTFSFGAITYTEAGTYEYHVFEYDPAMDAALPGMAYSLASYRVTVTVTEGESADALTGQLVAVVAYDNASSGNEGDAAVTNAAAFTNTYQAAPVEGAPVVAKELVGRDLVAGEFEFELTAGEGSPLIGEPGAAEAVAVAVAQNAADGSVTFPSITFTEAGKFEYTISEVAGNAAGITYDSATYTVSAVVTDDGQGQLAVTWQYADGEGDEGAEGAASEGIVFTNTYVPNPVEVGFDVTKLYEGADLTEGQFTFELRDASGKIIQTAKNDAEGLVSFEGLTFAEVGTYVYAVSEVDDGQENVVYDDAVHEVTIVVTDNLEGYLEAEVQMPEDGIEFTNEYDEPDDGGKISQTGDDLMRTIGLLAIAAILGLGVMVHSRSRAANSVVHRR